jgi:hypothetical protein
MLMCGLQSIVVKFFKEISATVCIREIGRLAKPGDELRFLNRTILQTSDGHEVEGCWQLVKSLAQKLAPTEAKAVATPCVRYSKVKE